MNWRFWITAFVCTLTYLGQLPNTQQVYAQVPPSTSTVASDITPEARRIAGLVLCQNALAEQILVIGNNRGLCDTLLLSQTVQNVTWAHPMAGHVQTHRPSASTDERLVLHTDTVTSLLESHTQTYDIIIVNLSGPLTSGYRDTMSPAFHSLVLKALTPIGLVAFSAPGSSTDSLPPHHTFLANTLYQRLNAQFLQVLLVPGDSLFFLCAQINYMTAYTPRLEVRFSLLDQCDAILPRELLTEMYDPQRGMAFQSQLESVDSDIPFTPSLYRLLQGAHKFNLNLLPYLKPIRQLGPWYLSIPILTAALLRLLYVFTNRPRRKTQTSLAPTKPAVWDAALLVRCSGILLWITMHLLFYNAPEMPWPWGHMILGLGLAGSILLIQYTRHWFAPLPNKYPYFGLILGLAQGFLLTGFLFIPLFKIQATLWTVCLFILACLCLWGVHKFRTIYPGPLSSNHALFTPAGYTLLWIGLSLILTLQVIDSVTRPRLESPLIQSVPEWTDNLQVTSKNLALKDEAPPIPYQEVRNGQQLAGYIFQTRDFTGTVYGYGGPIGLILFVEPDGALIDFRFTQSYETPRYIYRIRGWLNSLKGRTVFGSTPMQNVHAVSGATLTTRAVLRLMRTAGQRFATDVLAQESIRIQDNPITLVRTHKGFILFIAGLCLSLAAIFHGKFWGRIAVLIYTTGTFGFWLNKQYSTEHVMRLLTWDNIFSGTPESLALLIGVPIFILLFGNVYCGYLCPFGALQELISLIIPKRFKPRLSHTTVQGARFVKYAVLFALVISVFALKNKDSLLIDPLTSVFNRQLWPELFLAPLWLCLGLGCLFVTRFWCRFLCPTGAFLSLLNRCAWLKNLLPAKKQGRCEFDLTGRDQLDCIYCDRCNYRNKLIPERKDTITRERPGLISRVFLIWLLITTSLLIWPLVHKERPTADPNTSEISSQVNPGIDMSPY